MKKIIELIGVSKQYEDNVVVKDLDMCVKKNEFLTLLGPSGCGKTTTLRMIAGFETPTKGEVFFSGKKVTELPANERQINTVFQRYALFPHLNVYENIAFGLRIKKISEEEIAKKVAKMLKLVNLESYEKRKIDSLSGGQQQRIAIARALVNEPEVLLLDEPLGALDLKLRKEMQTELKEMQRELGITFIYVTHDQEEALTMSDKIIVMNDGIIQQIGEPTDIYNEPENAFVADFIGESNIFKGIMKKDYLVTYEEIDLECLDAGFEENEEIDIVIRPEDVKVVGYNESQIRGTVTDVVFKGVHYEMCFDIDGVQWLCHSTKEEKVGEKIGIFLVPDDIHIMKKSEYSEKLRRYKVGGES